MAALIAGVLWRAARPSELAYRHTRMHPTRTKYVSTYRTSLRRTAGALFYRTGRRGSDADPRSESSPRVRPATARRRARGGMLGDDEGGAPKEREKILDRTCVPIQVYRFSSTTIRVSTR